MHSLKIKYKSFIITYNLLMIGIANFTISILAIIQNFEGLLNVVEKVKGFVYL